MASSFAMLFNGHQPDSCLQSNVKRDPPRHRRTMVQEDTMAHVLDMSGHRYGRLTVLHREPNSRLGRARWHCRCDCGREATYDGANIRNGKSLSCGCLRGQRAGGGHWPDKATATRWTYYRKHARERHLEWALGHDGFLRLTTSPCTYCGDPGSHGVDRKDSLKGYTPDNCVPCCETCNRAKTDMPLADWLAWLDRIAGLRITARPGRIEAA